MEMKYSEEAKMLINNLKDFDKAGFEKWLLETLTAGSRNILEYILEKENRKKKIIIPKVEVK